MLQRLLPFYPPVKMIAAAPDGAPRSGLVTKSFKNYLPAVPRRGPEAGVHHMEMIFMILCENQID